MASETSSAEPSLEVLVPPIEIQIPFRASTATAYVLEVVKLSTVRKYLVSCQIRYKCYLSQKFHLMVSDFDELKYKLRAEASKMKMLILSGLTYDMYKVC
ncbi:MAG: hypothetical protein ABGW50_02125 [Thermococcus sp.]